MIHVPVSKPSGSGFAVHWTAPIAEQLGFYADEGLEVEIVQLNQADGTAALVSGEVPIMRRCPDETVALIAGGAPLRIVAGLIGKSPIYLYATPGVRGVSDLRGRTIAGISARFGSSLVLRMLLEDEGLAPDDYEIVHVGGSHDRFAAMRSGRAAAAVLSPPTDRYAEQAGYSLLARLPERYPDFVFSAIQAQNAFAEQNPEVMIGLMKAEIRAQRMLGDPARKGDAIRILAEADGIGVADAESIYATMVEGDRVFATDGAIAPAAVEFVIRTMIRFGDVRTPLAAGNCFDRRYLDEAARRLDRGL